MTDHLGLEEYQRIVADAEQEAREADQLTVALEDRVRDGDDEITPAELDNARSLRGFAKLRAEVARRKADRAREAERQRQLTDLRSEIEQSTPTTVAALAELLRTAEAALIDFAQACQQRNMQVGEWRRRTQALGVPPLTTPWLLAEHQRVGWTGGTHGYGGALVVGEYPPTRYTTVDTAVYVGCVVARVAQAHKLDSHTLTLTRSDVDPYDRLQRGG